MGGQPLLLLALVVRGLILLPLTMYRALTGSSLGPYSCGHQPMRMHLVPNQHFASPMIDYFLLSRVPKKFRIELFALNICRWIIRIICATGRVSLSAIRRGRSP